MHCVAVLPSKSCPRHKVLFWPFPRLRTIRDDNASVVKERKDQPGWLIDLGQESQFPNLTFVILADGTELWRSEPLQESGEWAAFDVDLTGARELKLLIESGRQVDGAHAAWLDPILAE